MKKYIIALLGLVVMACNNTCYGAGLNESDVKKLISEYIDNNGGQLSSSIESYMMNRQYEETEASLKDHSPILGDKDAKVTLIEFSDYRCGYCRLAQKTMNQLRDKYGDKVKFSFKFMPILSEESRNAAFAAQAANVQGKFWEYHAGLWEGQSRLGEELYVELAEKHGLDVKKFNKDRESKEVQMAVYQDYEDGQKFGASGTPYFMINGEPLSGAQPYENFVKAIDLILKKADS